MSILSVCRFAGILISLYAVYGLSTIKQVNCPIILKEPSVMVYHINMIKYEHTLTYCNGALTNYMYTYYADNREIINALTQYPNETGYVTIMGIHNKNQIKLYCILDYGFIMLILMICLA